MMENIRVQCLQFIQINLAHKFLWSDLERRFEYFKIAKLTVLVLVLNSSRVKSSPKDTKVREREQMKVAPQHTISGWTN